MAINIQTFLPISSSSSAIVKSVRGKVSSAKILKSNKPIKNLNDTIDFVNVRLIDIDTILKKNLFLQESIKKDQKKEDEKNKFDKKEEELEQKEEKKKKVKLPFNVPSLGIFDRINRFITFTLLGWVVNKLFKYLPALLEFSKNISPVIDFVEKFVGNVFNAVVNFIDLGYKAYDTVRNYTKQLGGEPFQKTFDAFSKNLNTFINLAIIAGVATTGRTDFGLGKKATKNVAEKEIGKTATRSFITKGARKSLVGTLGRGGTRTLLKSIKPLVGKLPLIGGLIEFGLSWALGDPIGKSAFRGIGATLIGAIGSVIGGPIGLFLGSWAGGEAGGALYDVIFNNKKKINGPNTEIKGKRTGGKVTTRGGKVVGGTIKRSLRKTLPSPKVRPIIPGASVGGKKEVQKIFPEPQGTQIGKSVNPFGFLKETTESMGQVPFLGPLFTLFGKVLLGQIPDKDDYSNIGLGINAWINNAIGNGFLRGNIIKGFNRGGLVDFETEMRQNISGWVEKSVEDLIKNKVTDAINELRKNLGMEPLQENVSGEDVTDMGGELGSASDAVGGARLLMAAGFPPLAAAILSGNIQQESGWKGQRTPWVLNDGAGTNKGLISWNRTRIINAERFLGKPLETASNAEQIKWIKEELRQYGLLDEFMDPSRSEEQLKKDAYKYIGWGHEGDRWKYSRQIYSAIQRGEQGTYQRPSTTRGPSGPITDTGLKDSQGRPIKLVSPAAKSFIRMARDAQQQGINLGSGISNSLRSTEQNIAVGGASGSRHLSGEAFDINWNTPSGVWIRNNANKYGFRYNPYSSQSTHFDWIGKRDGGIVGKKIKSIQRRTSYEKSTETIMIIQPVIVEKVIPTGKNKKTINFSGGGVNNNSKISQLSIR